MGNNAGSGKGAKRGQPLPWGKPGHVGRYHPTSPKKGKNGEAITQTHKHPFGTGIKKDG